ncbi:MAG: hypothetical protein AB7L91_17375 [Dehalococcoidia bacterium]
MSGKVYRPQQVRTPIQALTHLQQNKRALGIQIIRGEPNWYRANELASIVDALDLENSSQIVGSVGLSSISLGHGGTLRNPLDDLQLVRNFIAHKNPVNLADVQAKLSPAKCEDVHSFLWAKTSGGAERFYTWTSAIRIIAVAACD